MQEYSTAAIVLDQQYSGESDARIFLFTKDLGRVTARAKSVRSIHSKLAGHLQPLSLVQVRLVQTVGFQIVDALAIRNLGHGAPPHKLRELLEVARLIKELTEVGQPDKELWHLIERGDLLSKSFLKIIGFDPAHAICDRCESKTPSSFILKDMVYLCRNCFTNSRTDVRVHVTTS